MTKQDFVHLAEVAMSVRMKYPEDSDFDEVVRRFIWAIRASPDGSHDLDDNNFREMCYGRKNFEA